MAARDFETPANIFAEQAVLGMMLIDQDAAALGLAALSEQSFSGRDERNVLVFRAMKSVEEKHSPVDLQTVTNELINANCFESAGGNEYLRQLLDVPMSPENIEHYIRIVNDQAVLRDFLLKMREGILEYRKAGEFKDVGEFLARYTADLTRISGKRSVGEFRTAEVVARAVQKMLEAEGQRSANGITGVDTGYTDMNRLTHGWQKGDLIVIAARPSVGKTAFAINLAVNAARKTGKPVAFFSAEMSADQIMKRIISSESHVTGDDLLAPMYLDARRRAQVASAIDHIATYPIFFDDTPNIRLGDLLAKARKLKGAHEDLSLIVIDYLNLITTEHQESRALEVQQISMSLKELARSLKVPVIALAQLNRASDMNPKGVPTLANLRESGSIENDADLVLLMYRSDYYQNQAQGKGAQNGEKNYRERLEESVEQGKKEAGDKASMSITEVRVAKNRNGALGTCYYLFSKAYSRFDMPDDDTRRAIAREKNEPMADPEE